MNNIRPYIVQGFFIFVALVYVSKLFYLQIIDDEYKLKAKDNTIRKISVYPYRGVILDRNDEPLVVNQPVFDLMVVKREIKNFDTLKLCKLLNIEPQFVRETLNGITGLATNKPEPFLKQIPLVEYLAISDIFKFTGFYFSPRTVRFYPSAVMANALGYIAEISRKELDRDSAIGYYKQGDYVGKGGVEKSYEKELRGKRGARYVIVDVKGVEKGRLKNGEFDEISEAGQNLKLSIDLELQKYGELLMNKKIGSIVAIEPKTGEILAIVTAPSYDPNLLVGRDYSKFYKVLVQDSLKPLFDRTTQAGYPPGSIFKIIQASIGLQEKLITSTGITQVEPYPNMGDHSPAGSYDVKRAITISSNWYFAKLFKRMIQRDKFDNKYIDSEYGFDIWYKYLINYGLGHKLGSDISHELGGSVPSNAFYDKIYGDKRWKASTMISNSIGQGELLVVPLQMANVAATIANKGYYYTPHIVKGIGEKDSLPPRFKEKHYVGVEARHYDIIHDAMEDVVNHGTGMWARIKDIAVCGKTGTAENPHGEDHSVFIAFAPKENPKIAICVYVENAGFGGSWAAPISSLMIEKYLTDSISKPSRYKEKLMLEKKFIP